MKQKKAIKAELNNIVDFVRTTSKQPNVDGFDVHSSKHPDRCYIFAKNEATQETLYVLQVNMDWVSPLDRPLIVNSINQGMTGMKELDAETLENEMVQKMRPSEKEQMKKDAAAMAQVENFKQEGSND